MQTYISYTYQLHNEFFYYFTESLLNIHEDLWRDHWILVAFMPIYDQERSKRPTQGYKCDSARAMRLYHNCCRHILGTWKHKTQNFRVMSLGNGSRHQVRSFRGGLLAQSWVINRSILCIFYYYLLHFILWYCLHINHFMHILGA